MQAENLPISIQEFQKKLDALRNKIAIQQSLMTSITAEFESLYSGFESLRHNFDSTSINSESTRDINGATSFDYESTSHNFESSSKNSDSTSINFGSTGDVNDASSSNSESTPHNFESSSNNNGTTSIHLLKDKIIKSSKAIKVYFAQPNIPERMAKVLSTVSEKEKLSVAEMQTLTNASRNSLVRDMKVLKQLGWLKFNGSRKNGYFTLTEEGEKAVVG